MFPRLFIDVSVHNAFQALFFEMIEMLHERAGLRVPIQRGIKGIIINRTQYVVLIH
jgi:hypothetical protein